MRRVSWLACFLLLLAACEARSRAAAPSPEPKPEPLPGGVGSRVFVVERSTSSLAVYDLSSRELLPRRIEKLGDLTHATMVFSVDLSSAYLATRSGKLTRIALDSLEVTSDVFTSKNSIDVAVSHSGRYVATAEYAPGGVTVLDARSLRVVRRLQAPDSRVTGIVDAPGHRFVCVLMDKPAVWLIDASGDPEQITVEARVTLPADEAYDAMITPDGEHYLVGHRNSERVSVVSVAHPELGARQISLRDPTRTYDQAPPVKLPHLAAWAVARGRVFVPLVGEKRLAVLENGSFRFLGSISLRGHPVYAVRAPSEREVWVSFSGAEDDAYVQIIDAENLSVLSTLEVGKRIYHFDFTPRGAEVLVSANGADQLIVIDARTRKLLDQESLRSPSGIFGPWRAFRLGL